MFCAKSLSFFLVKKEAGWWIFSSPFGGAGRPDVRAVVSKSTMWHAHTKFFAKQSLSSRHKLQLITHEAVDLHSHLKTMCKISQHSGFAARSIPCVSHWAPRDSRDPRLLLTKPKVGNPRNLKPAKLTPIRRWHPIPHSPDEPHRSLDSTSRIVARGAFSTVKSSKLSKLHRSHLSHHSTHCFGRVYFGKSAFCMLQVWVSPISHCGDLPRSQICIFLWTSWLIAA